MIGRLAHRAAARTLGPHRLQKLQQYGRRLRGALCPRAVRAQFVHRLEDALRMSLAGCGTVLRLESRKEYVRVIFDASACEWKLGTAATVKSREQAIRLRSREFTLHPLGSQNAIQGLGSVAAILNVLYDFGGFKRFEFIRQDGQSVRMRVTPRNIFESGDLAQLMLSNDDVFHIQNLREFLLHVSKHGVTSAAAATRGGSMKAWLLTSSDFEHIEEVPELMEKCKEAFFELFREGFVSTVYFHMNVNNEVPGPELYERTTIMESRRLVQNCDEPPHPVVRGAMDFFQNIWPGVEEEDGPCPDLQFLWTYHPEFLTPHEIHPSRGGETLASDFGPVNVNRPTSDIIHPQPYPQPLVSEFSREYRAQLRAAINEHNFRMRHPGGVESGLTLNSSRQAQETTRLGNVARNVSQASTSRNTHRQPAGHSGLNLNGADVSGPGLEDMTKAEAARSAARLATTSHFDQPRIDRVIRKFPRPPQIPFIIHGGPGSFDNNVPWPTMMREGRESDLLRGFLERAGIPITSHVTGTLESESTYTSLQLFVGKTDDDAELLMLTVLLQALRERLKRPLPKSLAKSLARSSMMMMLMTIRPR